MCMQYSSTDGPGVQSGAIMFLQAQAGDLASLNQLMSLHDGLVQAMVRRQVLGDLPFAEALPSAVRTGLRRPVVSDSGELSWVLTPLAALPSPLMPVPALCVRCGEQSSCMARNRRALRVEWSNHCQPRTALSMSSRLLRSEQRWQRWSVAYQDACDM